MKAAFLMLLAGCGADVCAAFDGHSCIALEVRGSFAIDRLGIGVDGILAEQLSPADGPRQPPVPLPVDIAVLPGDTVSASVTLQVRALLDGQTVAHTVSPPVDIQPRQHRSLTLDLSPDADLGATDLAQAPDLAKPDLAGGPFCQGVTVTTLAGSGSPSFINGKGAAAGFDNPTGVAFDSAGNVYVADNDNHSIRKIAPDGATTTLAGNGTPGFMDGKGGSARFQNPNEVAVDGAGDLYVADTANLRVRKLSPDGTATTLAGNGTQGFVDGTGGANGTTELGDPFGLTVDSSGTVYLSDGDRIRKLAPDGSTTTLTGNGTPGFFDGTGGPDGTSELNAPVGMAVDALGNVYFAELINNRIRMAAPDGTTLTVSGDGNSGITDGSATTARFSSPNGLARDAVGNLYVGDENNHRIRRIAADGSTITVAGAVGFGFQDGSGCAARFDSPTGVAVQGKLLVVADTGNHRIRLVQLP